MVSRRPGFGEILRTGDWLVLTGRQAWAEKNFEIRKTNTYFVVQSAFLLWISNTHL